MTAKKIELLFLAVVLIMILGFSAAYQYGTLETVMVRIEDKERVTSRSGDDFMSKYLIFTTHETFENTDAWCHLKFASSDLYNFLKKDQTYKITVYGWRIPFFSMYRNIVRAELVNEPYFNGSF